MEIAIFLRKFANFCENLQVFAKICRFLRKFVDFAKICRFLRKFANFCENLQIFAKTYRFLRKFVNFCEVILGGNYKICKQLAHARYFLDNLTVSANVTVV